MFPTLQVVYAFSIDSSRRFFTRGLVARQTLSPSGVSISSDTASELINENIRELEKKFWDLNNQTQINLSSTRQVANAIQCKSTSKAGLEAILQEDVYSSTQKQMADIILQWKHLNRRKIQLQKEGIKYFSSTQESEEIYRSNLISQNVKLSVSAQAADDRHHRLFSVPRNDYDTFIDSLFASKTCQIDEVWRDVLLYKIDKPSAKNLIFQLDSNVCPMGFSPFASADASFVGLTPSLTTTNLQRKTPLVDFVRERKKRHPTSIVITRVGDFYEAMGLDAILLVQCCGLNPMGGKARAGCPIKNIQQTLDDLTQCGFCIAMYEEAMDTDSSTGRGSNAGSKSQLKRRIFAQNVSPANPTYMYDLCLGIDNIDSLSSQIESRPHVGIVHTSAGYTVVEINWEERIVRVSERLPAEAVACRLAAYPPVEPLFYVPTPSELESSRSSMSTILLPFLPSRPDGTSGSAGSQTRIKWLRPFLLSRESAEISEVERCKNVVVNELLRTLEESESPVDVQKKFSAEDFILFRSNASSNPLYIETMPLHKETAIQLGLLSNPAIPNLVAYLLPQSTPAAARRFLKRWLLVPPPPCIADSMRRLVKYLMEQENPQPPLYVPQVGKLVSLIRASQASSSVFRELIGTLLTTLTIIDEYSRAGVVDNFLALVEHESGMKAEELCLHSRCLMALQCIEKVVQPFGEALQVDRCSDFGGFVPRAFFERNEEDWRGRIRREIVERNYVEVECAAQVLVETMKRDFWGFHGDNMSNLDLISNSRASSLIVHDIFNNMLALKSIPRWATSDHEGKYYHPRDRNGILLKNRWTTKEVDAALFAYLQACQNTCSDVKSALTQLSATLCNFGHLPTIVQAAHANLILSTTYHHAAHANKQKWNLANIFEPDQIDNDCAGSFSRLWPYWMDEAASVSNSFELCGLFILTSPNMSGKSTLMRSTAAAALLTSCGLCAPLGKDSWIRRFDALFVRGASADVPSEGKSAFGAEMGDIAALLRSCGEQSLVFVDELARGTSPRDGTSLAGAVLEEMALRGMCGFFATHLHGILHLPLKEAANSRLGRKRMALKESTLGDPTQSYGWTYKMEDGVCSDSLALKTAERFGLSRHILSRAESFFEIVTDVQVISSRDLGRPEELTSSVDNSLLAKSKSYRGNEREKGLPAISSFLEGMIKAKVFQIPCQYLPPAQLAGSSCVYVLELNDGSSHRYYVGQTANLPNRIIQHRRKGKIWKTFDAIAVPIEKGTDEARIIESLTIRELARLGYELVSWADG